MRKWLAVSTPLVLCLVAVATAACGSSPKASATSHSTKSAFCAANVKLDKASANVTSDAGFLAVLKANSADLDALDNNAPAGKVGQEVRALVKAARAAVAAGNANALNSPSLDSAGSDVDTYCGVDGNGDPLPPYFAAGKGSAFCSVAGSINQGTSSATSSTGVLTFLAAHQTLINQYATYVPNLPTSVRSDAQSLVTTSRAAIAANNASLLGTAAVENASASVALYCGQNE